MKGLTLIFLFVSTLSFAQKRDTILKYFDAQLHLTDKKNAVYAGAAIRQQDHWFVFALYPDTSYILKAYYKDKTLSVKDGPYEVFYPHNKLAVAGAYHEDARIGVWRTWPENGQLKDSGLLNDNIRMGVWKSWYPDGQLKEESFFSNDATLQTPQFRRALALSGLQSWGLK